VDFLKKTAEILKSGWEGAGVDQVSLKTFNPGDPGNATVKSRDYEMLLFGNVLENPLDLFPFWHSSQRIYPGLNLALYQNQKADTLIETVRQTGDEVKQRETLEQIQNAILGDVPAAFLFSLPYTYVHSGDLGGFSETSVTNPAEKFRNVNLWYVAQVRVIK
jgi:ABC-type transport system substrate-binding protein